MNSSSSVAAEPAAPAVGADEGESRFLLFGRIADEVKACVLAGGEPNLAAYAARYPQLAGEIRELVETLALVQILGPDFDESEAAPRPDHLSRKGPVELGDFRILREIGRGGMGVVYEAEQLSLSRRVALKVLPFAAVIDPRHLQRFKNEALAAAQIDHPHIVDVYGVGNERGVHYYAMRFIDGRTLAQVIDELRRRESIAGGDAGTGAPGEPKALARPALQPQGREETDPRGAVARVPNAAEPPAAAQTGPIAGVSTCHSIRDREYFRSVARIGRQIAEALDHAHQHGVIHRDIKPSNVIVDEHGKAWVTDFGLARMGTETNLTMTGDLVGTLRYMSPEQIAGGRAVVDHRTDIYSLGTTLYELLTLRPVFDELDRQELLRQIARGEPRPPRRWNCDVPAELETIVLTAMAAGAADRYPTARELAQDLECFLRDEPIRAQRPSLAQRLRRWARRHQVAARAIAISAAAVALTAILLLAISNGRIREEQRHTSDENSRAVKAQRLANERARQIEQDLERLQAATALLDRGRWYADNMRWDDANRALTSAVELRPDFVSAWVVRSELYARLGLWDFAAADMTRAWELQELDTVWRWHQLALLRAAAGDHEGYSTLCDRMRARFGGTVNHRNSCEIVRACVLAPASDADLAPLLKVARANVVNEPGAWYYRYLLGAVQYRLGDYSQALDSLQTSLADQVAPSRELTYPLLAMAYHRVGQAAEAREALEQAARSIDRWTSEMFRVSDLDWLHHRGAVGFWPIAWWDWLECCHYYHEARLLIDGVPPADDPRLAVFRARAFAGLRWNSRADSEYVAALELLPEDRQVRLEGYRTRGYCRAEEQNWIAAASEFACASALDPHDVSLRRFRAAGEFAAGNLTEYRKTCRDLLDRFGATADPQVACNVVLACVLLDDSLPDMSQLLPVAEVAAPRWHFGMWVRGAALYRAGRDGEAIRCFETEAGIFHLRAFEWSFLAMARHRLGRVEDARRSLDEARRWIEEANRNAGDDASGARPAWGEWHEPVVCRLLLREAEALLRAPGGQSP